MLKIGFVTTHPIQYQVPVFRHLASDPEIDFTAIFCQIPDAKQQGDGFGVDFQWDVPLLDGYAYQTLKNVSPQPNVTSFRGCDTPEIDSAIGDGHFDAIVVNGWVVKSCLQTLRACRRHGVPCLVRGEANSLRQRPWWKRLLHRQLLKKYSGFLYIGNANKKFYLDHGIENSRLFPALYCVENNRFIAAADKAKIRRQEIRQRWNIPEKASCFLFSGKLIEKKHPIEMLHFFSDASAQQTGLHLLVVGDGELRSDCEQIAASTKQPITFTGFLNQSEIIDAYVASDCLLLPSDAGETWGLVTNEAMACGRPAIVSDLAGCSQDLICPGKTGYVVPFGDWKAWSEHVTSLGSDPDRLRQMGQNCQDFIQSYSPAAAAAGIIQAVTANLK